MLIFGGNWCYDCHVLDQALHEGQANKIVKESFLLVHVDIGEGDKNLDLIKKYETTLGSGVPTVVLIDDEGRVIYSSTKGIVYYDSDGTGSTKAVEIAKIGKKLKMTAADFFVI